ncbi:MAG: ribosome small subunit-dependent GTPase A [Treponema sp.]|nr:ribosome small subunit-dependent GTPase A [Treponema sp.]
MQGTVLDGTNNLFTISCSDNIVRLCSIKGKVLKNSARYYNALAPGDIVEVAQDVLDSHKGQITSLVPRKNEFVRWNVKKRCPQLLAANLDVIILVTTPDEPPFRPRFIDRALMQAEAQNITPVIVCNKCDLPSHRDIDFQSRMKIWEDLGYTTLHVSAKTGEGLRTFAHLLENHTSAFVGQSGVGKSSLVNALTGSETLRTGALSQKYERGAHTTTKGTLNKILIADSVSGKQSVRAAIIDTPGIRRFVLHDIAAEDAALYFREFAPIVGTCTFGMSCTHTNESGCRILEAVHAGIITEERYESWQRIKNEIATQSWED